MSHVVCKYENCTKKITKKIDCVFFRVILKQSNIVFVNWDHFDCPKLVFLLFLLHFY